MLWANDSDETIIKYAKKLCPFCPAFTVPLSTLQPGELTVANVYFMEDPIRVERYNMFRNLG